MQQLASVCTLVNFVASGFLLPTYCRPSVAIAVPLLTSRVLRSIALVFDSSNLSKQMLSKSSTSSDHALYSSPSSSTLIRRIHFSNHSHSAFGVSFCPSLFDVLSIACMLGCEVVPLPLQQDGPFLCNKMFGAILSRVCAPSVSGLFTRTQTEHACTEMDTLASRFNCAQPIAASSQLSLSMSHHSDLHLFHTGPTFTTKSLLLCTSLLPHLHSTSSLRSRVSSCTRQVFLGPRLSSFSLKDPLTSATNA